MPHRLGASGGAGGAKEPPLPPAIARRAACRGVAETAAASDAQTRPCWGTRGIYRRCGAPLRQLYPLASHRGPAACKQHLGCRMLSVSLPRNRECIAPYLSRRIGCQHEPPHARGPPARAQRPAHHTPIERSMDQAPRCSRRGVCNTLPAAASAAFTRPRAPEV
jgi:hypothetical protein